MVQPYKVVVLISGNGSNLQAIIDKTLTSALPIQIQAVISSSDKAFGLERAQKNSIPTHILLTQNYDDRNEYDKALTDCIAQYAPDLIVLAGFMRILGEDFLKNFPNIINIHPSLLPLYPGLNTHGLAIAEGRLEHGCSIHFVNEQLDSGPLIAQAVIKISKDDEVSHLKERVHKAEHFLYPTVINWFAHRRVRLENNKVFLDCVPLPTTGLRFVLNGL